MNAQQQQERQANVSSSEFTTETKVYVAATQAPAPAPAHHAKLPLTMRELSEKIRTQTCDWLMENILAELVFDRKTHTEKHQLLSQAFLYLMDIATIMDAADEGISSDIVIKLVMQHYESRRSSIGENPLHALFSKLLTWFHSNKKDENTTLTQEIWGLSLVRITETYFDPKYDRTPFFVCLTKARAAFNACLKVDENRLGAAWGLGMAMLQHSKLIEPEADLNKQTAYMLLLRAQEKMTDVSIRLAKSTSEKRIFLALAGHVNYQLARVYSLLSDVDGCFYFLTKAKAENDLPPLPQVLACPDFATVSTNIEFITIANEDSTHARERLAFEDDMRAKLMSSQNLNLDSIQDLMASVSLKTTTSSLSESMLVRNALSRSTLDFLVDGNLGISVNWRAFFMPIVAPQDASSKRLEERMKLYGVKPSPNTIPGDGNCQMHSLSDQLCGNLKHHAHIRYRLTTWLKNNAKLLLPNGAILEQFVHDQSWESYCASMTKLGTWGDHLTLIAAAEVFRTKIVIVSSVPGDNYIVEIAPTFSASLNRLLMLSHLAEFHYGSVVPEQ